MTIPSGDIPMTIIGGYLGAGKTTVINRLLSQNQGQRLAVLVNDFGALNIDVELIEYQQGNTYGLSNGCVCCSITDDLGTTLVEVTGAEDPPDQIILETSGVAEPAKLAVYCDGWPGVTLQSIFIIADAETIETRSRDKFVGGLVRRQLLAADLLIMNKLDLIDTGQLAHLRVWLEQQGVHAQILETQHGAIPLELLLTSANNLNCQEPERINEGDHYHGEEFYSLVIEDEFPWRREKLIATLNDIPSHLIRAKGIVSIIEEASVGSYLLQLVGRRYSIQKFDKNQEKSPATRLVLIGINKGGDLDEIAQRLKSCAGPI